MELFQFQANTSNWNDKRDSKPKTRHVSPIAGGISFVGVFFCVKPDRMSCSGYLDRWPKWGRKKTTKKKQTLDAISKTYSVPAPCSERSSDFSHFYTHLTRGLFTFSPHPIAVFLTSRWKSFRSTFSALHAPLANPFLLVVAFNYTHCETKPNRFGLQTDWRGSAHHITAPNVGCSIPENGHRY